jgi:branched-chain amino acid transport system substrate-binding protein
LEAKRRGFLGAVWHYLDFALMNRNVIRRRVLVIIARTFVFLAVWLIALQTVAAEDLRIPLLVGQTGASQTFGRNETDGYILAAEERNAKGGVNGRRVVLEFQDTETSAKQIISAFHLQAAKGAQVVLGPTWLDGFPAVIPVARKKGVLLVTPSAAVEAFSDSDRAWPVSFYHNSTTEIKVLVEGLKKKNRSRIALIYEQEPFAEMIRKLLVSETSPLVADIGVQAGESDFRAHLAKLRNQPVDVVVVFVWDQRSLLSLLQQIRSSMPEISLATVHDGAGWLEDPAFKPFITRLIYTQFVIADDSFQQRFKARFGYAPILTASNAYDALNAVLSAFAAGAKTGASCRDYLMNNQLDSVTFGTFRFNRDGSVPSKVDIVDFISDKL